MYDVHPYTFIIFSKHENRPFDCFMYSFLFVKKKTSSNCFFFFSFEEETCHLTVLYYVNLSVCTNLFCMNTFLRLIIIGTTLHMYKDVIEPHILI
jgi:hypothetical protein